MHVRKVYNEVQFTWVNSPLFHEFVENAHNLLYYKTDWREPKSFNGQEVHEFYQEDLDEEGYISFCNREDDGAEDNQGGGGPAVAVLAAPVAPVAPVAPEGGEASDDEDGAAPPQVHQESWAGRSAQLVRCTYGQAALEVTKGHHSQPLMVESLLTFVGDLAKEVERVGRLRKKRIARHNADLLTPGVPRPTVKIGPSVNYERIIRSNSNKYTKSTYGWAVGTI